jgi:2-aminoadipate transaminase
MIITTGSTQGIDMFARSLLNEGDPILVESPTFLGALQTFRLARADIHTVDLESDGVGIEPLENAIKKHRPKFFYIIPTFQNPSGITTSAEKRREIYNVCKRHGVMILEDDPYAALRYSGRPLESIKARDDCGLVCRLMSFSKTISPGLRVGYAIAHKEIIAKFNLIKQGEDVCTSCLSQALVKGYLESGRYDSHISSLIERYSAQKDAMLLSMDRYFPAEVKYTRPDGGLFVWVTLPRGMDAARLFEKSLEKKVAFVTGSPFFADGGHENTLRLNFSMPTIPDIETAIERLGQIIREYD